MGAGNLGRRNSGQLLYLDATITRAHSDDAARLQARSRRDGSAAEEAANAKHARYRAAGGGLVALAFETGGRAAEETVAFLRGYALDAELEDPSVGLGRLWQELSLLVQTGNAEMVRSAVG